MENNSISIAYSYYSDVKIVFNIALWSVTPTWIPFLKKQTNNNNDNDKNVVCDKKNRVYYHRWIELNVARVEYKAINLVVVAET